MSEWKTVKLGDICEKVCSGGTPNKKKTDYYFEGDIPWLNTGEITFNRIRKTEKYITQEGYDNSSAKWIPSDSVVVAMYGASAARVGITKIPLTTNQACCNLVIDKNRSDYRFVYYYLCSQYQNLASLANGGAQQNLNAGQIKDYTIPLPPLSEQKIIADTLSALDDKIENNNKINHNLEQMAQAIFKSWFVDFEPFGGVMPSDWREGILNEVCSFNTERINISDLTLDTYVSTENMCPNKNGVNRATTLPTIPQTTAFISEDILISNIRPYFKKIVFCNFSGGCSTDVLCFRPKKKDLAHYVFNVLYCDNFFDYMVAGSKGTKMPRGDKQQIMNYHITIPSAQVLVDFNAIVAPLTKEHFLFSQETKRLSELRDSLLPRLMSGELDVSKIEDYAAKL